MDETKAASKSRMNEAFINFMLDIPMFDRILGDELKIIANHMNFIELKKNETLFSEGDRGDYVCFVVVGTVLVMKKTSEGRTVVIAQLSKGRSIGEMSIIDNTPRSATIRAGTRAILLTLSKKGFDTIADTHPRIGIKILKGLSRLLSMNMRRTSSMLADRMLTGT